MLYQSLSALLLCCFLVSISTQTLLYSSRFSFAKILNAGHGLLVSRQQKSFRTSDEVISESSRRLMREICPHGMSKEDCNEGVGETGGSAWSLDWSCCWSISWFCGRQINYPIVYVRRAVDGDWSVRRLLCWFTGCLSFVPVGVLAFRKKRWKSKCVFWHFRRILC